VSTYDARDSNDFGGRGYYMAQALKNQLVSLKYIGPLKRKYIHRVLLRTKFLCYLYMTGKVYSIHRDRMLLKSYAKQIKNKLNSLDVDIVFSPTSPGSQPTAYLDTDKPIAMWSDTPLAGAINYYPNLSNLCNETLRDGITHERFALEKCSLTIYKSEWAAQTAIKTYHVDPAKVKVVPGGPHLVCNRTMRQIETLIHSRPTQKCRLFFFGADWWRKGGAIAVAVAKELNKRGLNTELVIAGCQPPLKPIPSHIRILGYLDKSTQDGLYMINKLYSQSHFLIVPSRAEALGIVFCEASSFGLPSIATKVGGIPTAVRDGINGMTFAKNAEISEYCNYIYDLFSDYELYKQLARSSFTEYQSRLNWEVAGKTVKKLLNELIS